MTLSPHHRLQTAGISGSSSWEQVALPLEATGSAVRERYEARYRFMREHLARTVRRASPLLLDLCAPARLDELACILAPGPGLPWSPGGGRGVKNADSYRTRRAEAFVKVDGCDPAGLLELLVVGDTLHAELQVGTARVSTWLSPARLMLRERLPDTIALAIVGRRLGDVLDHALLAGRDYPIVKSAPFSAGFGTLIHFAAEPRPWILPWAR